MAKLNNNHDYFISMAEWICKEGCDAECCGPLPMKNTLINENRHLFQRKVIKEFEFKKFDSTLLFTEDAKCVFLSNEFKCVIYDKRPETCKKFGIVDMLKCPHIDSDGTPRN